MWVCDCCTCPFTVCVKSSMPTFTALSVVFAGERNQKYKDLKRREETMDGEWSACCITVDSV